MKAASHYPALDVVIKHGAVQSLFRKHSEKLGVSPLPLICQTVAVASGLTGLGSQVVPIGGMAWSEEVLIWSAAVGYPGSRKSAIYGVIAKDLSRACDKLMKAAWEDDGTGTPQLKLTDPSGAYPTHTATLMNVGHDVCGLSRHSKASSFLPQRRSRGPTRSARRTTAF